MKKILSLFTLVLAVAVGTVAFDAEAKRLGGGKSSGMQRQSTTAPTGANQTGAPAQAAPAAAPAAAAAQGAAAASKRSWMGPLAGIAAGLGLVALASHFGFGEALANMMLIGLLVMAGLMAFAFFMRKRAAGQGATFAGAGANAGADQGMGHGARPAQDPLAAFRSASPSQPQSGSLIGSRIGSGLGAGVGAGLGRAPVASAIPADFDAAAFARNAKSQFLALQAANDAADFAKLADYLSPEMLQVVREEIAERGGAAQETQVFGLEAQVLAVAQEESRYVVSVRFTGSVRTEAGVAPDDLDEVWHLTKPRDGQGGWVIAGIEQGTVGH
jgi:predicted lipid-binding transport protein (Tim44 family)